MSPSLTRCLFLFHQILLIHSKWETSPTVMLQEDSGMAIGYYNGVITLLGGPNDFFDIQEYSIEDDSFSWHTEPKWDGEHNDLYGDSQFWTQVNHFIFMLCNDGKTLNVYDLENRNYIQSWEDELLEKALNIYEGCLTSKDRILYFIGTISVLVHSSLSLSLRKKTCKCLLDNRKWTRFNVFCIQNIQPWTCERFVFLINSAEKLYFRLFWEPKALKTVLEEFSKKSNVQQKKAEFSMTSA